MGTRSIITVKGKPFIATHWDGYPMGMGANLLKAKTIAQVVKVADHHSIDFADTDHPALKPFMEARIVAIAKKAKKPVKYIKDLHARGRMITFGVMSPEDYLIDSIKNYGDFAEWQYDYDNGKWKVRELHGEWPKSKKSAGAWTTIQDAIKKEKAERKAYEKQRKEEEAKKKGGT